MVAFNFSPEFAGQVECGTKNRTFRRTAHGKVGDRAQLFTGQRTKACRKLWRTDPVLTGITPVTIKLDALYIKHVPVGRACFDAFAKNDGFPNYAAMVAWLQRRYGGDKWSGYLHIWAPVAAIQAGVAEAAE